MGRLRRAMAGLLAAGLLLAVCVLGAGGAFKAHSAEYDYATRTLKLTAVEASECARGGGCLPMTRDFVAQATRVSRDASRVITRLELEVKALQLSVCKPEKQ